MMLFPTIQSDWSIAEISDQASADAAIPRAARAGGLLVVVARLRGPLNLECVTFDRWSVFNVLEGDGIDRRSHCQSIPNATCRRVGLVIVAGEVGDDAKPLHPEWVRSLRDQCQAAGVPFWFAGWGEWEVWERLTNREVAPSNLEWLTLGGTLYLCEFDTNRPCVPVHRVGTAYTGRELDGREWSELPKAVAQ